MPVGLATLIEIRVWRIASQEHIKYHGFPRSLLETLDFGQKVIEHSKLDGMEDIRPVQVICFHTPKMPAHPWDWDSTDGVETVVTALYSLMVCSSFRFLLLPICLVQDYWLWPVGPEVWGKNMRPNFILRILTLRSIIELDAHTVGMLHEIHRHGQSGQQQRILGPEHGHWAHELMSHRSGNRVNISSNMFVGSRGTCWIKLNCFRLLEVEFCLKVVLY